MKGQWLGRYTSNTEGHLLVDIDEVSGKFVGYAVLQPDDANMPVIFTDFGFPCGSIKNDLSVHLRCLDPHTWQPEEWENVKKSYPGVTLEPTAQVSFELKDDTLVIEWNSSNSIKGQAILPRTKAGEPSTLVPINGIATWSDFKIYVDQLEMNAFAFRGQRSNEWRLRTTFHRTGRANLVRYDINDMPAVHKHLSGLTKHVFSLNDQLQKGAFVSLIQHHGYPTPLLDWTHSPYVASFFAFRGLKNKEPTINKADKVRIFQFAIRDWNKLNQFHSLSPLPPHVTILDALAIENSRMLPQQAISTITNVDDIESYIQAVEKVNGRGYIQAIDLPTSEYSQVSQDLARMGITAGSLLPGLDGACEQLRERYFPP